MLSDNPENVFQDRTIYEDAHIFAGNLHDMGLISGRDFATYMKLFDITSNLIPKPDLLIYLKSSVPTLISQIRRRGREYEQTMQLDYLKNLNDSYDDFIYHKYPGRVLTIETDGIDFEHNPSDFANIVDKINAHLFGLFPDT